MRRLALLLLTALVLVAVAPDASAQVEGPNRRIRAQQPDSFLRGVGKRVLFSTGNGDPSPARFVRVRNTGGSPLVISNTRFTGDTPSSFALVNPGTDTNFTLNSGVKRDILVRFVPQNAAGGYEAFLTFDTNEAPGAQGTIRLEGLNAIGYEEAREPTLRAILASAGFAPAGLPGTNLNPNVTYEDEVANPSFWRARKLDERVSLTPLARYSSVVTGPCCRMGYFSRANGAQTQLQRFPGGSDPRGGENQKLLPIAVDGSRREFIPAGDFGIYGSDQFSNQPGRPFRVFRARPIGRRLRAGLWLVVQDQGAGTGGSVPNNDFNDFVWLMRNARPAT